MDRPLRERVLLVAIPLLFGVLALCPLWGTDLGYQVATGEWMLSHGTVPITDSFSFLARGLPYTNIPIAADVVFALVQRFGGTTGLVLLTSWIAMCASVGVGVVARRAGAPFALACVVQVFIGLLEQPRLSCLRPAGFGTVLLLVVLALALEMARAPTWRRAVWLALVCPLWAAFHGTHLLYAPVVGALVVQLVVTGQREGAVRAAIAGVVGVLAASLVPGALDAWGFVLHGGGSSVLANHVLEHTPVSGRGFEALLIVTTALGLVGGVLHIRRAPLSLLLSVIACAWLSGGVRALYEAILLSLPGLVLLLRSVHAHDDKRRLVLASVLLSVAWGTHVSMAPGIAFHSTFGFGIDPSLAPDRCVVQLHKMPPRRIYNSYNIGGRLIAQGIEVMQDSRGLSAYPDALYQSVILDMESSSAGMEHWLRALHIDTALVMDDRLPALAILGSSEWLPLEFDACCTLLVRASTPGVDVLRPYRELRYLRDDAWEARYLDALALDDNRVRVLAAELRRAAAEGAPEDSAPDRLVAFVQTQRPALWARLLAAH